MKVLIIAALALVAVHATPHVPYGRGTYGGRGGGSYGGGGEHGYSGYEGGSHGIFDEGYGSHGMNAGHDVRHEESALDKTLHQHHVSDINRGGVSSGGRGGHIHSDQGSYQAGDNGYGREYDYGRYGI